MSRTLKPILVLGNLKKEYIMDVYPLTAEEFEQTEKITSAEVLAVINDSDVEVE